MGEEQLHRPRISKESMDRLDAICRNEFGVDPDLSPYEVKIQILMGHFDANHWASSDEEETNQDDVESSRNDSESTT